MKLGKYIYQLLLENETVIIPGFGAFISDYEPAVIDLENSEVKPPSKNITFTSKIRNNDGLLVDSIAEAEGISHFNALKIIEKERDKIQMALDKGLKVKLEDVGMLWFNNNEIEFEPGFADNMLLESFGLDVTSLEKSENKENEKEPEVSILTDGIEAEIVHEPIFENQVLVIEETVDKITSVKEIDTIDEPHQETEPKDNPDDTEAKLVDYWKETEVHKYEPEVKSNRKWWFLLILIPLFIAGYFILNNRQKSPEKVVSSQNEVTQQTNKPLINSADSAIIDTIKKDTVKSETGEKKIENPIVSADVTPKYYLVGGSFSKEENMVNYIEKLKKKGIEGINLGKRGKFFIVGIAHFDTEKEAYKALNAQMRTNPENELWVLKK